MSETGTQPPVELLRALATFAEPPSEAHARLAEVLELGGVPDNAEFSDVFLFQLYPYASVYLGDEGMMGGEARARVGGFWAALGQRPPAEPDHLAALVGLYASLAEAAAAATGAERVLLERGRATLLHEHLAPWVFAFLARVAELASGPYRAWAGVLSTALKAEWGALGSGGGGLDVRGLPTHLAVAAGLPDPREEGGDAFLSGLLAPVRSGMIVTRADLAGLARATGLGLRAGERRYALRHLVGQDPVTALRALAAHAERAVSEHEDRVAWLGASARFHANRAEAARGLLESLAREGADALEVAAEPHGAAASQEGRRAAPPIRPSAAGAPR